MSKRKVSNAEIHRRAIGRLYGFLRSGYWDGAKSSDFYYLYKWCAKRVWGTWYCDGLLDMINETSRVGNFYYRACNYDEYLMASYIRWVWLKEKARKDRGERESHVSTKIVFAHGGLMAQYRYEMAQAAKKIRNRLEYAATAQLTT